MSVVEFPSLPPVSSYLTDTERQAIIAALYRAGITQYEMSTSKHGCVCAIGWIDRYDGLGWHIRKIAGEYALCDDQSLAVLTASPRLNDILSKLV